MKVVLVGVGHWTRHLRDLFADTVVDDVLALRPNEVLKLRRMEADVVVRVGMRPGAGTPRGRAFDAAWSRLVPPERRVTYWIGTDVYDAAHDVERDGRPLRDLGGIHLAGAPWLQAELQRIGIDAELQVFPGAPVELGPLVPFPDTFRVVAYVPDDKPEFYGILVLEQLAARLSDIRFDVYGSTRTSPVSNLRYLGRTDDMLREFDAAVVHVRATRHDAIAGTVREALARGRHVIFGYEHPGVLAVAPWDVDGIERQLRNLAAAFDAGSLELNTAGAEAAAPYFARGTANPLAERLQAIGESALRSRRATSTATPAAPTE